MIIGQRLRDIRESKNLSQGDIEKSTGLLRCYVSRVENGHTVPSLETLEKWASALKMPLYQIMHEGDEPPRPLKIPSATEEKLWGASGRQARDLDRLRRSLAKMVEADRKLVLALVSHMAHHPRMK
jgi:transcriptional regulator with XRE-family HTH domain